MGDSGWTSRGYLPHLDLPNLIQFVTFRLVDSLPDHVIQDLEAGLRMVPEGRKAKERHARTEERLGQGLGACWLGRPEIAQVVEDVLLETDGNGCRLLAWTIMPNHAHLVAEVEPAQPLFELVRTWKGRSAFRANRLLGRSGPFWYHDYFDRFMRDGAHLLKTLEYIDLNPVVAGLCKSPEAWPFGSARFGMDARRRLEDLAGSGL